jgi:uncharacterized cofD-like protein
MHLGLEAVMDGKTITGQVNIALARGTINRIGVLPPDAPASESAIRAIDAADQIVLGPGSLYTSVIATLAVSGITEAVNRAKASLIYITNLVTQDGETLGLDAADHLDALVRMTGLRPPGAIVASDSPVHVDPPQEQLVVDGEAIATFGVDLITADLLDREAERPVHDPSRLGEVLRGLVET